MQFKDAAIAGLISNTDNEEAATVAMETEGCKGCPGNSVNERILSECNS